VGLEIGWHLRLTRSRVIEALVKPSLRETLVDAAATAGIFELAVIEEEGYLRGVFTRQCPVPEA